MLQAIKQFFEQNISLARTDDIDHQLQLATAALLIEMMQQDARIHEGEQKAVREMLQNHFNLTDNETLQLCELAREELDNAVDSHQFTSLIARNYSQAEKIRIIEYLWQVAYADDHLDPLEEHMVRHIAELIYVPHRDFIRTKHKFR